MLFYNKPNEKTGLVTIMVGLRASTTYSADPSVSLINLISYDIKRLAAAHIIVVVFRTVQERTNSIVRFSLHYESSRRSHRIKESKLVLSSCVRSHLIELS